MKLSVREVAGRLAAVAVGSSLLTACAGPSPLGEAGSPIIGGTATTGDPAVVMLVAYPPDLSSFDTCSASVIAPAVLLTAAHCVDPAGHPGYLFGAFTGPDASAYTTIAELAPHLASAKAVHAHPDYDPNAPFHADLGVVVLDQPLGITPLPVNRAPLTASITGALARIVGYGQTVYLQFNVVKHEASTVVAALGTEDTVIVGDASHRSCIGDSGGPALVQVGGVEAIIGVDSYTDTTGCLDPANYRRPDLYLPFIDTYAPPPEMDAGTDASGGTGAGGSAGAGGHAGAGGSTETSSNSGTGGATTTPPAAHSGCSIGGGDASNASALAALALSLGLVRRRRRVAASRRA